MYELAGIIVFIAYIALEIYGLLRTEKPKAKYVVKTIIVTILALIAIASLSLQMQF